MIERLPWRLHWRRVRTDNYVYLYVRRRWSIAWNMAMDRWSR
jgi:hypothetical protein